MTKPVSSLSRETDLLVLLSDVSFTEDVKERAADLCRYVSDWRLFTRNAIKHGVAALVWQNLNDLGLAGFLTENERLILEKTRLRTISRVTFITSVATELVSELEKEGINVLLLKGLALEHSVYGSRGLRQMSDADLLVSPDNVIRARDIINAKGFVSRSMKSSLYKYIILEVSNHLPEMHKGGISIDLHHRLFGPRAARMTEHALQFPGEIMAGGRRCFILPPQIAFLSMVSHMNKHEAQGEFQLRLYCDIYLLLKNHPGEIFTVDLIEKAREAGIENDVMRILYIMSKAFKSDIPEGFADNNNGDEFLGKFRFNLENPGLNPPVSQRERYCSTIRSLPGVRCKLIFIAGDLFPSIAFMKKRYNCHSYIGCLLKYPHRAGKLIWAIRSIFST